MTWERLIRLLLLVAAIVLFVVAGLGGHTGSVDELDIVAFGLAFFAAAHLP